MCAIVSTEARSVIIKSATAGLTVRHIVGRIDGRIGGNIAGSITGLMSGSIAGSMFATATSAAAIGATATAIVNATVRVVGVGVVVVGEPSATPGVIGSTTGDGRTDENFVVCT